MKYVISTGNLCTDKEMRFLRSLSQCFIGVSGQFDEVKIFLKVKEFAAT